MWGFAVSEETPRASTPVETTTESVISIIRSSQGLPADEPLDGNLYLIEKGLAFDSVALLELALALEEYFELRIDDREMTTENFETVAAVVKLIERKLETSAPIDA
jgi:acyl carrier protein